LLAFVKLTVKFGHFYQP